MRTDHLRERMLNVAAGAGEQSFNCSKAALAAHVGAMIFNDQMCGVEASRVAAQVAHVLAFGGQHTSRRLVSHLMTEHHM